MGQSQTEKAAKEFEELLSAAWAAQLAQLRSHQVSSESQAAQGSQETNGKEGDTR